MKARHDRVSRDPLSLGKSKQEPFSVVLLERERGSTSCQVPRRAVFELNLAVHTQVRPVLDDGGFPPSYHASE